MNTIKILVISFVVLLSSIAFAEDVSFTLTSGTTWSGEIGQTVSVEYEDKGKRTVISGELTRATNSYIMVEDEFLFIENIISIKSDGVAKDNSGANEESESDNAVDTEKNSSEASDASEAKPEPVEGELPSGVFCLPLHEMVGTYFRDEEITQLVNHIEENYGLGQIIVLEIKSGGGAVHIWDKIRDAIWDARERHRVIAWVESAGSGAAATTFCCDEVYFRSYANCGSITMYSGSIENAAPDWQADGWVRELESVLARSSHNPMIAGSMVRSKYNYSFDIDPETGEVTHYNHEFGDHVLSKSGRNNMLNSDEALMCTMSDGTADSGEELAKFLDLEEWVEIDSYGRDIAKKWKETLDTFQIEFPQLAQEFQGAVVADNQKEALSKRIKAGQEMMKWYKKLGPNTWPMMANGIPVEMIEREIENLKRQRTLID